VPGPDSASHPPRFAHASEAELARILDFYAVRWAYEPRVFPLQWSLDGAVVESFAPDFYLPDFDLYLELTTLRQPLVRKKNRKLRRLRELYPDVRVKLFYARDFRALMLKYGKLALVDALSGTPGQVTPPARPNRQAGEGSTPQEAPTAANATSEPQPERAFAAAAVPQPPGRRRRGSSDNAQPTTAIAAAPEATS
jgi:hypoxanthine phosphoribosyltransferase